MSPRLSSDKIQHKKYIALNVYIIKQIMLVYFSGNGHGYVPLVVNTFRSFPHSGLITGFATRLTRRMQLVEQELSTIPEHLNSPPVFRVTRSLVLF